MLGAEKNPAGDTVRAVLPSVDHEPVVRVAIDALRGADSPRSSGVNLEHARALAETGPAVPILVHHDTMRIIDGAHRVRAAALRGETSVNARFFHGDDADAFVLAVRANIAHGLPLSLAERKAAATRIVASHPYWSDRMIAALTGLAAKTVASACRPPTAENHQLAVRVGRDGRIRALNSVEGRRIASEIIAKHPDLSLRRIADAAGISPETVRKVRERLRRGESPFPAGRQGHPVGARNEPDAADEQATARLSIVVDSAVMQTLRTDPTLRLTEVGRYLLRLLDLNRLLTEHWERLADIVPPHSAGRVTDVAKKYAEAWQRFAEHLGRPK